MTLNCNTATLFDCMKYLEDLDNEGSVVNISTKDLLEKEKVNKKLTKEVFNILMNTIKAMEKGDIKINDKVVTPYTKNNTPSDYKTYAVDINDVVKIKSAKELGEILSGFDDWDIERVTAAGYYFKGSETGDKFSYNPSTGIITLHNKQYCYGKDFNCIHRDFERVIYLLKTSNSGVRGVSDIKWKDSIWS